MAPNSDEPASDVFENHVRVAIVGCGVVGTRAARQILSVAGVDELVLADPRPDHVASVARSLGPPARPADGDTLDDRLLENLDIAVLCGPPPHADLAERALRSGVHVVSVSDSLPDVESQLRLDAIARDCERVALVGVGFSPGLTCVLARHAAAEFDRVDELHVAKLGTAGPDCARQHHRALQSTGRDWRDGGWVDVRGGSGRELCWFPDPIAGADCYRAALSETLLLRPAFPSASRITARMAATRRDRLTARLPMLRKPHAEAGVGAVRVEVRGLRDGQSEVVVFGCMDRPSVAAATVLAAAVDCVIRGVAGEPGAGGCADRVEPVPFLAELARRGVKCARFEGSPAHAR